MMPGEKLHWPTPELPSFARNKNHDMTYFNYTFLNWVL